MALLNGQRTTKSNKINPDGGWFCIAVRRAYIITLPRSTSQYTHDRVSGSQRITRRALSVVIFIVLISSPFPYIAGHIESPIRADSSRERGDRRSVGITIAIPDQVCWILHGIIKITLFAREIIPPGIGVLAYSPGGFFPLCFCWELSASPFTISVRLSPVHVNYRVI